MTDDGFIHVPDSPSGRLDILVPEWIPGREVGGYVKNVVFQVVRYGQTQVVSPEFLEDPAIEEMVVEGLRRALYKKLREDRRTYIVGEPKLEVIDGFIPTSIRGPWWRRPFERLHLLSEREKNTPIVNFQLTVRAA